MFNVMGMICMDTRRRDVSTPSFPTKVLLPMLILSSTGPGVPWHSPGAQYVWASLDRLRTTRWKPTTASLGVTGHLAWQPSLGFVTHHGFSHHWSQRPNGCEWVCFKFVKKRAFCKNKWTTDWEKIFTMGLPDKGLPFRICTDFLWTNNKKTAQ